MMSDNNKLQMDELVKRGEILFPERKHHRLCPWRPGEVLPAGHICADCIYGVMAEREQVREVT
jgi:hypothetical protein